MPVRQWVLSLPFELRRLAAFRADVTRALVRIFIESVALEDLIEQNLGDLDPGEGRADLSLSDIATPQDLDLRRRFEGFSIPAVGA